MENKILELIVKEDYLNLKKELENINEQDLAELIGDLDSKQLVKIFRLLSKTMAAEVFSYLPIETAQELITVMSAKDAGQIIDLMASDDATDLFDEMPANVVTKILASTTKETRRDINELLKYPEDSAGSIMTVEYLDFKENMTIQECISKIRRDGAEKETINNCYVLDNKRKMLGSVEIKDLLLSAPDTLVKDIMEDQEIYAETLEDQEVVAEKFKKYDLLAMPVVDSEKRMVGIITIDDIIDIMEEETNEDIAKMAAITPSDKSYLSLSVWEIWKTRIPWLLLLMVSATFTSMIIQKYEAALATMVILTSYIPMFMDTAGNAGSQASVTIIRSLAINEVDFRDFFKVIWKELRVSLLCGVVLAGCNFIKLLILDKVGMMVALVVALTLLVTVIFAKIIGSTLPLLAKKIGFDPAVMASPFITTIVDAIALVVYFNIATSLLTL
ncbi:MAG: magnesium transporter [Firmicutes bacterium]|nr:magnesium transporter [Bacillota bacterium]